MTEPTPSIIDDRPNGAKALSGRLSALLEDAENDLPILTRDLLAECQEEHDRLMTRIERLEGRIKAWPASNSVSQRLAGIPGIGVLIASILVATVGEGQEKELMNAYRRSHTDCTREPWRDRSNRGGSNPVNVPKQGLRFFRKDPVGDFHRGQEIQLQQQARCKTAIDSAHQNSLGIRAVSM